MKPMAFDILNCLGNRLDNLYNFWGHFTNMSGFYQRSDLVPFVGELSPEEVATTIIFYGLKRVRITYLLSTHLPIVY